MNNYFNNWENWIYTCKSMKLDPYLIPYTKINSKWVKVLNIRAKTTKLLEENIGINLHDLKFSNSFFLFLSKNTSSNRKNNLDLMKIQNFCASKDTKKVKRQPTKLEKGFVHHISNKESVSKIHKELLQLKKTKNNFQWANDK